MLVLVVALVAVGFLVRLFADKEKSLEGVITNPSMLTTVPDLITWLVRESTVKIGVCAADTRQLSIPMIMVKKYLFMDFIFTRLIFIWL
jgi:hypothetical protein